MYVHFIKQKYELRQEIKNHFTIILFINIQCRDKGSELDVHQ